uniref:CSON013316 protein n=1 Tax=Culicoides sonorensis TaxID=179676 RepID=A0A336LG85_CULSO
MIKIIVPIILFIKFYCIEGEDIGGINFPSPESDFPDYENEAGDNPPYAYDDEGPGLLRQGTSTATICFCAPIGTCVNGTTNLGEGQLDPRVGGTTSNVVSTSQQRPIVTTTTAARVTSCPSATLQLCCSPGPYQCGITWPAVRGSPAPGKGQATFGQYPWQVVILDRSDTYLGSGALIDNFNVVTAAHKVVNFT